MNRVSVKEIIGYVAGSLTIFFGVLPRYLATTYTDQVSETVYYVSMRPMTTIIPVFMGLAVILMTYHLRLELRGEFPGRF